MILMPHRFGRVVLLLALLMASAGVRVARAQDSKSASLAKELAQLLIDKKLDSIATKGPGAPDEFVSALFFPGSQLLVVSARYSVPVLLNEKISAKDFRSVYIDLNSASIPESKVFVEDLGADGLKARRDEGQPFDSFDQAGKSLRLDSDWRRQKLTEEEYLKAFADADAKYSSMLSALIAELKKMS